MGACAEAVPAGRDRPRLGLRVVQAADLGGLRHAATELYGVKVQAQVSLTVLGGVLYAGEYMLGMRGRSQIYGCSIHLIIIVFT